MGHHDLRDDKECQNCGYAVDKAYCSQCGQHNTETRQSFHHLITHTIEDITHYDGNFWKTIKYLLFRPGKLTIEYLMGHRMRYVPPVKLYIFISFICFFLMALMAPDAEEEHVDTHSKTKVQDEPVAKNEGIEFDKRIYSGEREFDSIQNALPENEKLPKLLYYTGKALMKASENKVTPRDFIIAVSHTIPKILFIYMPIFAFWLWLFHGKKRWYFFDHGIFTLHYFSFLLLLITINMILSWVAHEFENNFLFMVTEIIKGLVGTASMFYSFFYFFRSHSKFYGETKATSRLKSFVLFLINIVLISTLTLATLIYIVLHLH